MELTYDSICFFFFVQRGNIKFHINMLMAGNVVFVNRNVSNCHVDGIFLRPLSAIIHFLMAIIIFDSIIFIDREYYQFMQFLFLRVSIQIMIGAHWMQWCELMIIIDEYEIESTEWHELNWILMTVGYTNI